MVAMTVEYRSLEGTGASVGRAGTHTLIADRPDGKASGMGLGFNGGQLLALSLGGCFCNDVHYTADALGVAILTLRVTVTLELEGDPLLASSAHVDVGCELVGGGNPTDLLKVAQDRCTVANTLRSGMQVTFD